MIHNKSIDQSNPWKLYLAIHCTTSDFYLLVLFLSLAENGNINVKKQGQHLTVACGVKTKIPTKGPKDQKTKMT